MKKTNVLTVFMVVVTLMFCSCVSMGVIMKGKEYFVGKQESVLVKYFNGEAASIDDETGEYDKIVWFTNKETSVVMTKENVARYKVSNKRQIFNLDYYEFDDGCRVIFGPNSQHRRYDAIRGYTQHTNNNVYINNQVSYFNNQVQRLRCIDISGEQAFLSKSNVGNTFYIAGVDWSTSNSKAFWIDNEICYLHTCTIWEANVQLKEVVETERHIAVRYSERNDSNYDEKGNIISEKQVDAIIKDYKNKGFDSHVTTNGLSVLAYIKDGKVIEVEDFDAKDE